ncbi:MAG TPA: hypothetical protein PKW30_02105 [Campylobacterales bacterium]|nr:hypothetical protein [Campylobacterales bacterium]
MIQSDKENTVKGATKTMKYFVLLSLLLCIAFGFEIEESKKISIKAAPTKMSGVVSFTTQHQTQIGAKSTLDTLLSEAKSKHPSCRGGEYYVYPLGEYAGQKKGAQKGYEGNIRFECRFSDISVYDEFLAFINAQVKQKDLNKVYIYPISWELAAEERELAAERLKYSAIEAIPRRAAELSRSAKAACDLKKISFDAPDGGYYPTMMKSATQKTEAPTPEAKEISLFVHMLFECKR